LQLTPLRGDTIGPILYALLIVNVFPIYQWRRG
jgi:hypothetical protein